MMRSVKGMIVVFVVLGMVTTASAAVLPAGYSGPLEIKYTNFDMATLYTPISPLPIVEYGAADINTAGAKYSQTVAPKAWNYDTGAFHDPGDPAQADDDLEDAWFVFKVSTIAGVGGVSLFADAPGVATEIVGIGYGMKDVGIVVDAGGTPTVYSTGLRFKVWEQPNGTMNYLQGSAGRVALDVFKSIGDTNLDGVIDALDQSTLLIDAMGVTGLMDAFVDSPAVDGDGDALPAFHHVSRAIENDAYLNMVHPSTSQWGDGNLANGEILSALSNDPVSEKNGRGIDTDMIDIQIGSSLRVYAGSISDDPSTAADDWMFRSSDPALTNIAIPEPATMTIVAMGLVGLVSRRRRRR